MTEQKVPPNIRALADEIRRDEHPNELFALFSAILQAVLPQYREAGAEAALEAAKEGRGSI